MSRQATGQWLKQTGQEMEPHGQSPWYLLIPCFAPMFSRWSFGGLSANETLCGFALGEHPPKQKLFRIHPRAKPVVFCEGK